MSQRFSLQTFVTVLTACIAIYAFYMAGKPAHIVESQPQVAFIDFPLILKESEAGKSLTAQMTPRQKALEEAAHAKLQELQNRQSEITKQHNVLTEGRYYEESQALQKEIDEWNAHAQKLQANLNNQGNAAIKGIQDVLRGELAPLAEENHYIAILPAEQAFYFEKQTDLTSEAIRRLDKKVTVINLQVDDQKE